MGHHFSSGSISSYLQSHDNKIPAHYFESSAFSSIMDSIGKVGKIIITRGRKTTTDPLVVLMGQLPEEISAHTHIPVTTDELRRSLPLLLSEMGEGDVMVVHKGTKRDMRQVVGYAIKPRTKEFG